MRWRKIPFYGAFRAIFSIKFQFAFLFVSRSRWNYAKAVFALPLNDSATSERASTTRNSFLLSPSFVLTNLSIFAIAIVYRLMARSEIGKQFYAGKEKAQIGERKSVVLRST
jgi:hypothetical protein